MSLKKKVVIITALVCCAVILMSFFSMKTEGFFAMAVKKTFQSPEVGVVELSPLGEEGGYAIPASGSSYTCTLSLSTYSYQEYTNTVTLYGSNAGLLTSMTVYRNGINIGNTSGAFTDSGSNSLPASSYTYTIQGSYDWGGQCESYDKMGCVSYAHSGTDTYSCSRTLTITPTPLPNVTASINNPGTQYVGQAFYFSGTEYNADTSFGQGHSARVNVRPQGGGVIVTLDTSLSGGLAAGSNRVVPDSGRTGDTTWTPSGAGTYEAQLCGDRANDVSESNEGDNCSPWVSFSVVGPDLSVPVGNMGVSGILTVGQPLTFTGRVQNGTAAPAVSSNARFCTRVVASQTSSDCISGTYNLVSNHSTGAIVGSGSVDLTSSSWTPTVAGQHYVYLYADTGNAVNEGNEGNNSNGILFTVNPLPDLRPTSAYPTANLSIPNPLNISFSGGLYNDGGPTLPGETITGTLEVDLNNNTCSAPTADISTSAGNFGTVFTGPRNLAATVNAGSLKNGIHCYRFLAAGASNDSNTANNNTAWTKFTITGLPESTADLTTTNSGPADSSSFDNPASIAFTGVVTNSGLEATLAGQQIWGDVEIDWNKGTSCLDAAAEQSFNAGGPWTELAKDATKNLSATISAANLRNGQHCYRMAADRDNFVAESNNSNNAAPWRRFTVTNLGGVITGGDNAPSGDIRANGSNNPTSITSGSSATLTWTSSDATACQVRPGNYNGLSSGGQSTGALTSSRTYGLYCSNASYPESLVDAVVVTVAAATGGGSNVSIDADKKQARLNEPIELVWDTGTNADCSITALNGYNSGILPIGAGNDGIHTIGVIRYTITCPTSGATDFVDIELIPDVWED